MTIAKSTVTEWMDDAVERLLDGPDTMGVSPIRLDELVFQMNLLNEEVVDDVKNIKADASTDDEGNDASVNIDVNDWPGGVDIANLVDGYNRDVQELFQADDDMEYFDIELHQTKETTTPMDPEPVSFTKDEGSIEFPDDDYDADDELELTIKLKEGYQHPELQETEWTVTLTVVDGS